MSFIEQWYLSIALYRFYPKEVFPIVTGLHATLDSFTAQLTAAALKQSSVVVIVVALVAIWSTPNSP
jgi:hypothetical protein